MDLLAINQRVRISKEHNSESRQLEACGQNGSDPLLKRWIWDIWGSSYLQEKEKVGTSDSWLTELLGEANGERKNFQGKLDVIQQTKR